VDFSQLFSRLKTLGGALSTAQRVSLAAAFLLVVGIMGASMYWIQRPSYALLFADLDPESANDVVARLKTAKVDYQLDEGGRSIRVPASKIDELRLEFASGGLPASGRIGFEIFDRTAFGATEFLEQVNYRRALEGEIARTIGTLGEVSSARVHIAMSRSSLFASKEQPAKASVVLKLRGNRPPAGATVQGIANLVASSVEGLRPEAVVILDSFGRPLARPQTAEDEPMGGAQMERQQKIEHDLTTKVVSLLEPVLGSEGVRVNVSVRLDPQSEEATEEKWDPATQAIRSRQVSGDAATLSASSSAQGLAGARSNLPAPVPSTPSGTPSPAAPAPAVTTTASTVPVRGSETTNYEISKTIRHTIRPRGEVARLSVAVILDNEGVVTKNQDGTSSRTTRPRKTEELQKIQAIVAAAVGLDTARGDQLTIENVPFGEIPVEEPARVTFWQRIEPQAWEGGRILGVIALGMLAFFMFVKPLMRRATAMGDTMVEVPGAAPTAPPETDSGARTIRDLEGEVEARLDAAVAEKSAENIKLPVLTRRIGALATKEPENAARLLRMWLSQETR
jgi:flagellar M-ring protein FliF